VLCISPRCNFEIKLAYKPGYPDNIFVPRHYLYLVLTLADE
jgi:hypothetical protein